MIDLALRVEVSRSPLNALLHVPGTKDGRASFKLPAPRRAKCRRVSSPIEDASGPLWKLVPAEMLVSHYNARGNAVLASLPRDAYARIEPFLHPVEFRVRQCVEASNKSVETVIFPCRGLLSAVAVSRDRRHEAEVGVIGLEGMTGASLLLGVERASLDIFVQIEGDGRAICARELRRLVDEHPGLRACFLRYLHTFFMQTARTALAGSRASLDQRVARWLLMAHDRVGRELQLTHELLALMLGVRRAGVTMAINQLEMLGLIEASRGLVAIINREGLEEHCQGFYGPAERESARWLPPPVAPVTEGM